MNGHPKRGSEVTTKARATVSTVMSAIDAASDQRVKELTQAAEASQTAGS